MRKLYPVDSLTSRRLALNRRDEVNKWKKKMAALIKGVPHVLDLFKLYYFNDAHNIETTPRKQQTFRDADTDFRGKVISRGNQWRGRELFGCFLMLHRNWINLLNKRVL